MTPLLSGWEFTIAALLFITAIFAVALYSLGGELRYLRALADYLGYELSAVEAGSARPPATLEVDAIRDEVRKVAATSDPLVASKQVREWQMRAHRLEPALAFWIDLLRQLGLLFTVVGLGLSFVIDRVDVGDLMTPLGLAVWTTVAGLFYSLVLSGLFGRNVPVWTDTCEKNIEAWDQRRRGDHVAGEAAR
jgi:hypothetical protein